MLAAGTYYLRSWEPNMRHIYLAAGAAASADTEVTGLSVAEGATLTLGNNNGPNNVYVSFANDIDNNGTITKEINGDYGYLNLYPDKYIASGAIVNAGTEDYENAGYVGIYASNGISNSGPINVSGFDEDNDVDGDGVVIGNENGGNGGEIYLDAGGYVLNSGMLDNSGGDGRGSGGYGGYINMYGAYVENTGELASSGGNNVSDPMVAGNGGYGGSVYMRADYVTNNTAAIDNSGGDGSSGGRGGYITLRNQDVGEVKNAGSLNMNGGAGTDSSGGRGGYLNMDATGGSALSSGDISAIGGNTTEGTSSGGDGGELMFMADGGEFSNAAPGDVVVSGNLAVSGGNATADGSGDGGDAGSIALDLYMNDNVASQRVALLGYASIDANAGDGAYGGEAAGSVPWLSSVDLDADHYETSNNVWFAGSAVNNVPINARGGNSTATDPDTGDGGAGGEVRIMGSTDEVVKSLNVTATNTADIDLSGGNAVGDETSNTDGGYGGEFSLSAYHGANNSGAVNGNAGNGGRWGGYGGEATIYSVAGAAVNSGALTFNGSDGGEYGYSGGSVYVFGASATNSADIGVNGGNATETDELVQSYGGWGGEVVISGIGLSAPSTNTGNVSYSGGTGDTDGEEGCLQVGITYEGNCN
jgi:hypothetical protein